MLHISHFNWGVGGGEGQNNVSAVILWARLLGCCMVIQSLLAPELTKPGRNGWIELTF